MLSYIKSFQISLKPEFSVSDTKSPIDNFDINLESASIKKNDIALTLLKDLTRLKGKGTTPFSNRHRIKLAFEENISRKRVVCQLSITLFISSFYFSSYNYDTYNS
jgi:hypothetical protein